MHKALPPLSSLRAFEAAARHLSFTKAAAELNVSASALSHQIRGLEAFLGVLLFERRTRSIALTAHGKTLFPGLAAGFSQIRDAVAELGTAHSAPIFVISTPPGFTSKWLAPRLFRFAEAHPDIDVRVSSSAGTANFVSDGIDAAIRSLPDGYAVDPTISYEHLFDVIATPLCSPALLARFGPLTRPGALAKVPLIHDDSLVGRPAAPGWEQWLQGAGMDAGNIARGLRFTSADHALNAALEGAGLLLSHSILAYDDLRSGRLVMPFGVDLPMQRAYYFVCPRARLKRPDIGHFLAWLRAEAAATPARLPSRESLSIPSGRKP